MDARGSRPPGLPFLPAPVPLQPVSPLLAVMGRPSQPRLCLPPWESLRCRTHALTLASFSLLRCGTELTWAHAGGLLGGQAGADPAPGVTRWPCLRSSRSPTAPAVTEWPGLSPLALASVGWGTLPRLAWEQHCCPF